MVLALKDHVASLSLLSSADLSTHSVCFEELASVFPCEFCDNKTGGSLDCDNLYSLGKLRCCGVIIQKLTGLSFVRRSQHLGVMAGAREGA